jgi:hypothetical protein
MTSADAAPACKKSITENTRGSTTAAGDAVFLLCKHQCWWWCTFCCKFVLVSGWAVYLFTTGFFFPALKTKKKLSDGQKTPHDSDDFAFCC